jgi:hypothetical protein
MNFAERRPFVSGVKRWIAVCLGCLVVGAVAGRMGTLPSGAGRNRRAELLFVENQALHARIVELEADRALAPEPKAEPPAPKEAEAAPPVPRASGAAKAMPGAAMAEVLGLDPARRKFFEDSYDRVVAKLREAEKRLATVTPRGDEVEIHIPPFPEEGGLLRQEWTRLLASVLTQVELERYASLGVDQVLFPREIGLWDRHVVLNPREHAEGGRPDGFGNRVLPLYHERWTRPGEPPVDPATRWPWSGTDADRCYRHLLP